MRKKVFLYYYHYYDIVCTCCGVRTCTDIADDNNVETLSMRISSLILGRHPFFYITYLNYLSNHKTLIECINEKDLLALILMKSIKHTLNHL